MSTASLHHSLQRGSIRSVALLWALHVLLLPRTRRLSTDAAPCVPMQTRGWFYTLMVLSTALFDRPAFQNLIVNGLVLAEVRVSVRACVVVRAVLLTAAQRAPTLSHTSHPRGTAGWQEDVEASQELPRPGHRR